jgi:hypothetical protein
MARPCLSVIPSRGRAHTLAFTLKTCLAQELPDCEFLVSDNSGADAVRETLGQFDDRRLRLVRTPKLHGYLVRHMVYQKLYRLGLLRY